MIIEARFYDDIADNLAAGAIAELEKAGATYERYQVPGAFEIPAAIQFAIRSMDFYTARKRFDGYVALGCVIRGETSHYDVVCEAVARGVQDMATRHTLAAGFGVITAENREQAMVRADMNGKNYGGKAACAALDMIRLKEHFSLFPR